MGVSSSLSTHLNTSLNKSFEFLDSIHLYLLHTLNGLTLLKALLDVPFIIIAMNKKPFLTECVDVLYIDLWKGV